jgi:hypothetical protein
LLEAGYSPIRNSVYYSCGYDSQGDLFIDGTTTSGSVEFAELPIGSSTFTNIALDKTLGDTGAVQWDGTYITVDDASAIYRLSISGSTGTVVGTTRVLGRKDPWKALNFIYHHRVIEPDGSERGKVGFWRREESYARPFALTIRRVLVTAFSGTIV